MLTSDPGLLTESHLPIEQTRPALLAALSRGPAVLSAPTGSGKSTQVPRWLLARGGGVLIVEPRRVACRALASRVAELEGCELGAAVGYAVRDERRAGPETRALFVTPGVALRMLRAGELRRYPALVLDEFHERSLDLDLLLALALKAPPAALVVMSATVAGDRVAAHLGGAHVRGEGRRYPVDTHYLPGRDALPGVRGLEERLLAAVEQARGDAGDILVFLPGVGEIGRAAAALRGGAGRGLEVLELHGRLKLSEQARIFSPGDPRRIILATNVAETSLTVPRIGVVIDSGLVRRTRYHGGRGYLTLTAVAADSADQRAGRAGRLGPGVCYRLWRQDARLDEHTPPEIHRESLVPLVLAAAACGAEDLALPFLDPPRPYAVEAARETLTELGAMGGDGGLSERGQRLFGLPVDAHLGRLLIEGERRGTLEMAVALAAGLSISRRLFVGRPEDPELDLRAAGCDATAIIRAVWEGRAGPHMLDHAALADARAAADRFRRFMGVERGRQALDRRALAETLLAAWPRCAHVARRRKRRVAWANGGTELSLGRDSALEEEKAEAALVLDSRALGVSETRQEIVITAAMPVPTAWLLAAGLGRERMAGCALERGALVARVERVYAGRVLAVEERAPEGALAREAVAELFLRGSLFKGGADRARERHELRGLQARLEGREPGPPLEAWVLARLAELGLEGGEDLALLEEEDLLPAPLEDYAREQLTRDFPRELAIGDARYRIAYDVERKLATLHQTGGARKAPPPDRFLPRLPGWRLAWEHKNRVRMLRER